jgi:ABC-type lipoprotein release transport system permease subunit
VNSDGAAAAVRLWSRSELGRRWPALVLLGVLAGVAAGLAMAAIDGAGRAETAYERMRADYDGADAVFFPSQIRSNVDSARLGEIPEVAAWAGFASTVSTIDGVPGGAPLIPVGSGWFTTIERAKLLEGRLPDPNRDDEAVINAAARDQGEQLGLGVGSVLTWRNLSPSDVEALGGDDPPADYDWSKATGPVTKLHVVGVVRLPMESVMSFASTPLLLPGPGWAKAHLMSGEAASSATGAQVNFFNAFVRLRHGAADVPAFQAAVARVYGRADIPVKDLSDDIKRVQRSLDVERTALLLFAAAVLAAAAVLVGQALVRSVRAGADAAPVLSAMGLSRPGLIAGLVAPHAVTALVAAIGAGVTAVVLSPRFPIGLGRQLDPDLGVHVNWRVLAIGVAATLAVALLACALVAWITVRGITGRPRARRAQLVGAATRAGAPVPAAVGASLALETAPSRSGGTARPALIAAVIGVLGVVGAVTLVGGIDDALQHPERVGRTWDLEAYPNDSGLDVDTATGIVAANPDIVASGMTSRFAAVVDGTDVPLYSLRSLTGSMQFAVLSGRGPDGDNELALGPRSAARLGAGIGDIITVGASRRAMTVVGIALLAQTPHTSFDEGAWLTPGGLDTTTGTVCCTGVRDDVMYLRVRSGVPVETVQAELADHGMYAEVPIVPPDVTNLSNVRGLPLLLAAFLVLLAIGAVAHALLTGARSRFHDLAVLRALGLTPRQAAACVTWQAAIIGGMALAIGIPLGIVVGRQVWHLLADSLSFVYVGPVVGVALLLIVPVALAVLGVMALWPARGAARLHTAEVLRTE